jgi:flavin reductase (DIM6/NTAB) family NADH-FMN oxidoreductase RutF
MPIDATTFRAVMGCFATGVTVITTAVDGRLHGLTANAVTSVSLDPLLVLVCVDKNANAHAELERASSFGVNILSGSQQDVSRLFATSASPEPTRLRGVEFDLGTTGVPLIRGSMATLECTVESRIPGGDHTIFVGRAVDGRLSNAGDPLLYFRGKYRRMAG